MEYFYKNVSTIRYVSFIFYNIQYLFLKFLENQRIHLIQKKIGYLIIYWTIFFSYSLITFRHYFYTG